MPFEIVRNDIVNMNVDAVVNSADTNPAIGYGVESAIYEKAGKGLLYYRKKIGKIPHGEAKISPAFDLSAKYVIHAVSPVWRGGNENEEKLLSSCYRQSLHLAMEYNCESIAFPILGAGNKGFDNGSALRTAVNEISGFLMENEMMVYLVVYDKSMFSLSEKLFMSVKSFIDEKYIEEKINESPVFSSGSIPLCERFMRPMPYPSANGSAQKKQRNIPSEEDFSAASFSRSLDELEFELEDTFSENLLRIIDRKGLTDPEVYKKANIDRKLFNKIKNNPSYRPSRITAIAFAIALELNLDETKDFIGRAGYALSRSSKFDVIIEYFITNKNYDIFEINEVLFAFDQQLIGA